MRKIVLGAIGVIGVIWVIGVIKPQMARAYVAIGCPLPSDPNQVCNPGTVRLIDNVYKTCDPTGQSTTWQVSGATAEVGSCAPAGDFTGSTVWYNQEVGSFAKKVFEPAETEINSDRYAKYSLDSIAMSIGIGAIGAPGQIAQGKNNSAVAQLGSAIAYMAGQPAVSSGEYLAYMGNKAGFVEQAYAQGAGYRGLLPILPIWVAFRNIAYLITSLMLVVIGFMIMLRKKIDAQTVIGVQQALPRIVVTLLLITFSYAIAGLVIDMIYFLIYLLIELAFTFGIYQRGAGNPGLMEILTHRSALRIGISELWWSKEGAVTAADAVGDMIKQLLGGAGMIGAIGDVLGQPIAYLIVSVAILFSVFKLFFSLLMAYIQIVLGTIIAPLQLMLGALPGSDAFGKWFRNLLANAMAFPATAVMFLLAGALLGLNETWGVNDGIGFINAVTNGTGFIPPFINGTGGGGDMPNAIQGLIGIGIILMTPKVVEMVKEALKAPEFKYGSAIGEAVGFGGKAPGYAVGLAGSGREYAEAMRYGDPSSSRYDPNYMSQLMFTNPQLYTRVSRGLSGGNRGRILQGIGYAFGGKRR